MKKLKKIIYLIGIVLFGLTLAACSNNSGAHPLKKVPQNSNSLIVYFSLTGHTKRAADQIHQYTGTREVRIIPKKAYPHNYDQDTKIAHHEKVTNARPAIKNKLPISKKYKTIYVGFPTWWYKPPMIIHTLFEQYNFKGKKIVPFMTSSITPMSSSMPVIRSLGKRDHAKVINGFRYTRNNQALKKYLRKNNLLKK